MIHIPAPRPGRPLYLNIEGGRLYVSVHDAFYLERQRDFKSQIRLAHPDCKHQRWECSHARNLLKARAQWEVEEARWYAHFGLEPPTRLPHRTSSVGNRSPGTFASLPPLPSPAADRNPSGFTLRSARASPAIDGRDHHNFADVICPPAEQHLTPSLTPTCHSPPDTWPRGMTGHTCFAPKTAASGGSKSP
jgi:hypothetical protein